MLRSNHWLLSFATLLIFLPLFTRGQSTWVGPSLNLDHGKLRVSENKRFLVFEDGTPFFWLGDTAWELFHRLSKDEAAMYLENRRAKGFTVIQAVILAELEGLDVPNAEGHLPLEGYDPTKINEAYFLHVDWIIKKAAEKGMFIGLVPTWGDKVTKRHGVGPEIFTVENARIYGEIIGKRYRNFSNIIYLMGADRPGSEEKNPIWTAMAEGIKSQDKNHLMTFHPNGAHSSSQWFHDADWLDFNMIQTSHGQRSYAAYIRWLIPDYERTPIKPVLDGEPRYEHFPVDWDYQTFGWFDDADVRQAAYQSLFSGAFGHTYGCHDVWQMNAPQHQPTRWARHYWYDVLNLPGAEDMFHVRKLLESRPFLDRIPFQQIVTNKYMPETEYNVATRGDDYVMVYLAAGKEVRLDLDLCGWPRAKAWWFNCQTGATTLIGDMDATGIRAFTPATRLRGNDWVLVLDNVEREFGVPGGVPLFK
ncbi:MAG: glycoside hydrolase family 140 protein [Bacteroidota bacterium]